MAPTNDTGDGAQTETLAEFRWVCWIDSGGEMRCRPSESELTRYENDQTPADQLLEAIQSYGGRKYELARQLLKLIVESPAPVSSDHIRRVVWTASALLNDVQQPATLLYTTACHCDDETGTSTVG